MNVDNADEQDVVDMVRLSAIKRKRYAEAQPVFWQAHPNADSNQEKWFRSLLLNDEYILLTAKKNDQLQGFIIGHIISAPDVYQPGGKTLFVDDFCVLEAWHPTGLQLFAQLASRAKGVDCNQALVVCGAHDTLKADFLKTMDFTCASHWFHKEL